MGEDHGSASGSWENSYVEFVRARAQALRGTAYLLCGDWYRAEDVTQIALTKLYLAWRRIERRGSVDAYARRVLVRAFLDDTRRPWRRERPTAAPPEHEAPSGRVDDRIDLGRVLAGLPPTQRAVVVLRYWEDLGIAETAEVLRVSEGTVKSSASRGLTALRTALREPSQPAAGQEQVNR
jgi:RNA polymerase sigma-70 factor (sigma-E family)